MLERQITTFCQHKEERKCGKSVLLWHLERKRGSDMSFPLSSPQATTPCISDQAQELTRMRWAQQRTSDAKLPKKNVTRRGSNNGAVRFLFDPNKIAAWGNATSHDTSLKLAKNVMTPTQQREKSKNCPKKILLRPGFDTRPSLNTHGIRYEPAFLLDSCRMFHFLLRIFE